MKTGGIFQGPTALGITALGHTFGEKAGSCSSGDDCENASEWNCISGTCTYVATVAPPGQKLPNNYGCYTGADCSSNFCNTAVPVAGMKGQCQTKGQVNPTIGGGSVPGAYCNDQLPCTDPLWCDSTNKCSGDITDYPCADPSVINYVLDSIGLPTNGVWSQAAQDKLNASNLTFQGTATGCKPPVPTVPVPGQPPAPAPPVPVTSKRTPTPQVVPVAAQSAGLFGMPLWAIGAGAVLLLGGVWFATKKKKPIAATPNRRRRRHHR